MDNSKSGKWYVTTQKRSNISTAITFAGDCKLIYDIIVVLCIFVDKCLSSTNNVLTNLPWLMNDCLIIENPSILKKI